MPATADQNRRSCIYSRITGRIDAASPCQSAEANARIHQAAGTGCAEKSFGSCRHETEVRTRVGPFRIRWTRRRIEQFALRHLHLPDRKFAKKFSTLFDCESAAKHS